MPLAPEIEKLMPGINARPKMSEVPLEISRLPRDRLDPSSFQQVGSVQDMQIPGPGGPLRSRMYNPAGAQGALPLVMMIHGGGFVFGDLEGYYDHICRVLCARANVRVLSVNYRLAPENKFPSATDDVYTALQWVHARAAECGVDTAQLFLAGGSAGANLAAVTTMRARDENGPTVRGQILLYPMADYHTPASTSLTTLADGYYLTRADVVWFWAQYLRDESDSCNPYAVPLRAASLAGLPPALVITAEYDPLRDGGERYALRMAQEGVEVKQSRYDGMVHGFLAFPTPRADDALQEIVAWLRARCKSQIDEVANP